MAQANKPISEAPESNAGDNFQVLWAMRKSFDLLNFESEGLKAITLEGIDPIDAKNIGGQQELLGIDMVEYFGGEDFVSSSKIIISQLKYSTRRKHVNWTFSALYKGKKAKSYEGSVIHRLAQVFKKFLKEYGRKEIMEKITIKLVSNRNISPSQLRLVKRIQQIIYNKKSISLNSVFQRIPDKRKVISKLKTTTSLNAKEFLDFIYLLDFSECGTGSRFIQEAAIVKSMINIGYQQFTAQHSLFRLISEKMLPEEINTGQNKITDLDLLNCLNSSKERLFPVKNRFEELEFYIPRRQVSEIINEHLLEKGKKLFCIHGGAGIGKSTVSVMIKNEFPKSSEVILFDCYGKGDYLNPSDQRHLHREAITQICNDLSKNTGSSLLVFDDQDSYLLIRRFKQRIEQAVKLIRSKNPTAVLVLIIDAADNSITAARKGEVKSFVEDLVREDWIEGFKLVITTRTYRIDSLNFPNQYTDIPLRPFDKQETESHLLRYFPESTKEEVEEFHRLTNGIPRVQSYILKLKKEGIDDLINYLKPNGKKVEDLIKDKIVDAAKKIGEDGEQKIDMFFKLLIALPRPVPIEYVERISGLNNSLIEDLSTDIWHGLILENDKLLFRDEDFETYIRETYIPNSDNLIKTANVLLQFADKDDYASINLGTALYDAKKFNELKNIVLEGKHRTLPKNPILNKEVYIARTKSAMGVSFSGADFLTFFKLSFIAAEVAKTDRALNDLLTSNFNLLAEIGEVDSIDRIHHRIAQNPSSGALYFNLAAIYSRQSSTTAIARNYLLSAEKWFNWLSREKKSGSKIDHKFSAKEISFGTEAYLRIHGAEKAFEWLKRWRPQKAVILAAKNLLENLRRSEDNDTLIIWFTSLKLSLYQKLLILEKLPDIGLKLFDPNLIIESIIPELGKSLKSNLDIIEVVISFCELCLYQIPLKEAQILTILKAIEITLPERVPYFSDVGLVGEFEEERSVLYLKKHSIKANIEESSLELKDIYPEHYKGEITDNRIIDDKRKFDNFYKYAIEVFHLRFNSFSLKKKEIQSKFDALCEEFSNDWRYRHEEGYWFQAKSKFLALVLLDIIPLIEDREINIDFVITAFSSRNTNAINLIIAVADKISNSKDLKPFVPKLLSRAELKIRELELPARTMVDYYVQLSKIAARINITLSNHYFQKAIEAVSEIDEEAQEQIKCLYQLTTLGLPIENSQLAFEFGRFVEYCKMKLADYDHFPMEEGLKGIANLDAATSYAFLCRASHRNMVDFPAFIVTISKIALEKEFINPIVAGSLITLNIYFWNAYVEYFISIVDEIDAKRNFALKNKFVHNVLRDLQLNCTEKHYTKIIIEIFDKIANGRFLDSNLLNKFKEYKEFRASLEEKRILKEDGVHQIESQGTVKIDLKEIDIAHIDITSSESINQGLAYIRNNAKSDFIQPEIQYYLEKLNQNCPPEKYIAHLNALIGLETNLVSHYTFERIMIQILGRWNSQALVRDWAKEKFPEILEHWISSFSMEDYIHYDGIKKFSGIFFIEDDELLRIIFNILPSRISNLSATQFYQTISFVKDKLSPAENETLIEWVLSRENRKIPEKFTDGSWANSKKVPKSSVEVIASTLRFSLGNPDRRIRWRGLHSLRRLVDSGDIEILRSLMAKQNDQDCNSFQHEKYTFFWMSAKLYLWIGMARIAEENPERILELKEAIIEELHYKDLPHVLILHFIQKTCQHLLNFDSSTFLDPEIEIITNILSPIPNIGNYNVNPILKKETEDNWRFDFDSMDTLPNWYGYLGSFFEVSGSDVANIAEKYIVEKWGVVDITRKDDHVSDDYELTSHRQGEIPVIENLMRYYEYHAMFCAAYELIQHEGFDENTLFEWLEMHTLAWENYWRSDFTDPVPMEEKFWVNKNEPWDKNWKDEVIESDFDNAINIDSLTTNKLIRPYGGYSIYKGKSYERVRINSALVSNLTGDALLRAFQSVKDNNDFYLPLENSDGEIKEKNYILQGWLKDASTEWSGLDEVDPCINDTGKNRVVLGTEIRQIFNIHYDKFQSVAYYKGKEIASYRNWNNSERNLNYENLKSQGKIFSINSEFMLSFLRRVDMSLIIDCRIDRYPDEESGSSEYVPKNTSKLYLIKPNGEVKTVARGSYKIG